MVLTFLLLLLMSVALSARSDSSILYSRVGMVIIFYSIISAIISLHVTYLQKGIGLYAGLFNITCVTHTFQIFIFFTCGIILMLTGFFPRKYLKTNRSIFTDLLKKKESIKIVNKMSEQFTIIEYSLIIVFVITGSTLLLCTNDLVSLYLCIELQSFSLYIICAIHRNSETSTGSALTYFLLGGLSSCFILLGIALIYTNTGITNMDAIHTLISYSENCLHSCGLYTNVYVFYSFLLISVGFLFKIAAAPFHWWSPDVYDGVPTVVTAFISIFGKISVLILLMELVNNTTELFSTAQTYSWISSLSLSCFFSFIIGTVLGLTQTRIKRLLAYSTVSHIGFILLALIVHNTESYQAFLFYIIQYVLTNLNAFLIILAIGFSLYLYYINASETNNLLEKDNSPIQLIGQIKGYFSVNPFLTLCLTITMFSFIGLPPLSGFFAKQMILTAALDNGKIILVITAVLTSVISAAYYLTIVKTLYFDRLYYKKSYGYVAISLSNHLSVTVSISTLVIMFFILIPNEPINLCSLLALIYSN